LLWYHALRREPYVDFPGLEEVVGKRIFLCVTSVVLCVSVVEFTAKTFTTEAQRLHREPQRRFFRQTLKAGLNSYRRYAPGGIIRNSFN
jgi:hypothetical protein